MRWHTWTKIKAQSQRDGQGHMYQEFLDLMKAFRTQQISTKEVIERVSDLFAKCPQLIEGFYPFLGSSRI